MRKERTTAIQSRNQILYRTQCKRRWDLKWEWILTSVQKHQQARHRGIQSHKNESKGRLPMSVQLLELAPLCLLFFLDIGGHQRVGKAHCSLRLLTLVRKRCLPW